MSSSSQIWSARVNWYFQSSLKHITEKITGNRFYYRGGRYRQVSLYHQFRISFSHLSRNAYLPVLPGSLLGHTSLFVNTCPVLKNTLANCRLTDVLDNLLRTKWQVSSVYINNSSDKYTFCIRHITVGWEYILYLIMIISTYKKLCDP